jgi:multicomponent Na+:H+ antiporter subunit F
VTAFLQGVSVLLGLAIVGSLYRVLRGPTNFDRLTGLGLIGTKTVVLIIVLGLLQGSVDLFVDMALTYAIIGFSGTMAIAKYLELGGKA